MVAAPTAVDNEIWHLFVKHYNITPEQQELFKRYYQLLAEWNDMHNITRITEPSAVVLDHFWDSLSIIKYIDFHMLRSIADVGSGGGFPGIPLKIMYPHLSLFLIEVNQKKVAFLEEVIEKLQLSNAYVCDQDWRTFLRKTDYVIDLFTARASLSMAELLRIFKASSLYRHAKLVYWASEHWQPTVEERPYLIKFHEYSVGNKIRRLVEFAMIQSNHS